MQNSSRDNPQQKTNDSVEETSKESFPASDAPSWAMGQKQQHQCALQVVNLQWQRTTPNDNPAFFNHDHLVTFGSGNTLILSCSEKLSNKSDAFNTAEELLLSAVASCYMTTLLTIAAKQGFFIKQYADHATSILKKNNEGQLIFKEINLKPRLTFNGNNIPDTQTLKKLQEEAKKACPIVNAINVPLNINLHCQTANKCE